MKPDDVERIAAAAIQHYKQTYSMLPPARHGEVLRLVHLIYPEDIIVPDDQGFVTTRGRFVGREEGKVIAAAAGRLLSDASPSKHLFSEDMW